MKRRLLIIAVFLLLGAVVNVAVAWGCALWVPLGPMRRLSPSEVMRRLPSQIERRPEYRTFEGFEILDPARTVLAMHAVELDNRGLESMVPLYTSVVSGWPSLSMDGLYTMGPNRIPREPFLAFLPPSLMDHVHYYYLPLRPRWPGFAVNTILYATALWLIIRGPFALRRFLRLRRGLCPKCAYPMGESAVCTECGCELPKRARTT